MLLVLTNSRDAAAAPKRCAALRLVVVVPWRTGVPSTAKVMPALRGSSGAGGMALRYPGGGLGSSIFSTIMRRKFSKYIGSATVVSLADDGLSRRAASSAGCDPGRAGTLKRPGVVGQTCPPRGGCCFPPRRTTREPRPCPRCLSSNAPVGQADRTCARSATRASPRAHALGTRTGTRAGQASHRPPRSRRQDPRPHRRQRRPRSAHH
jgi:hypothetical protein